MSFSRDGIDFRVSDGLGRITLNRPDSGNAIDLPLAQALFEAALQCELDGNVRAVVLTGSGRQFCAGGDVGVMKAAGDNLPATLTQLVGTFHAAVQRLAAMAKPLLVLVNGPAAGAGLSLAALGDIVLSARSAHYSAAYGAIGLTSDGGLSWLLPRLVGLRRAQEMILTNRRLSSEEAEASGLVTRMVDDAQLAAEGEKVATALVNAPIHALGAARSLLRESFETGLETQLDRELRSMSVAASCEAPEGLAAFFAKRPAVFR